MRGVKWSYGFSCEHRYMGVRKYGFAGGSAPRRQRSAFISFGYCTMRAAPGRSRAVAVYVCSIPIVYHRSLDRTYTETLDQPRARNPARWSRPHWYQCLFAHKRPHAHLAPTHMCRCAHAISVPPNPSALGLSGRAELPARVVYPCR